MRADLIKEDELQILLLDIARKYGYDFTEYSMASLKRRVNRLCLIDMHKNFTELRCRILNNEDYFSRFVEEITVNVTEMFRDPSFYKSLRENIIPELARHPHIKIWLAGCSTGEEVYSISILLHEAGLLHKTLLYATDINPSVLEVAKKGIYAIGDMKLYSENYMNSGGTRDFSTYYSAIYDRIKLREEFKLNTVFATHNLVADRSFNEFQLIICRNVLIYFNKDLQEKVFTLFDDSLEHSAFLALGSKETIRFSDLESKYKQIGREKIWKKVS
jgi:chemotaxis protein methyltransferase CheR